MRNETNLLFDHLLDTVVDCLFCVRFACRLQANHYALSLLERFLCKSGNSWNLKEYPLMLVVRKLSTHASSAKCAI